MNEDINVEKAIEATYMGIVENITDEIDLTSPPVCNIRDLKGAIKDANRDRMIHELRLSFGNMEFPCMAKRI